MSSVEKKEAELKKNMQIVVGDKAKIEETIEQLDVLKLEALENTWTKVSKYGDYIYFKSSGLTPRLQRLW